MLWYTFFFHVVDLLHPTVKYRTLYITTTKPRSSYILESISGLVHARVNPGPYTCQAGTLPWSYGLNLLQLYLFSQLFRGRVSPCRPGRPWTLRNLSAFASKVLRPKVCTVIPGPLQPFEVSFHCCITDYLHIQHLAVLKQQTFIITENIFIYLFFCVS